jgi:lipid II isoglutaminyl synthase (glutamine-hydrolysing)
MQRFIGTAVGKSVKHITRLRRGSGQALPGLIVERLFPRYFARMLEQLPEGVVIITGTNGKTTTTKMVVELLQANGKRVLTNPTGSNLTRGINSMLIHQATLDGRLPFDIAVLELDEAYARRFALEVKPRWVLALNVTRDQLDRFGEVDTAASMIADTMREALEGIVTNANDPRLLAEARQIITSRPTIKLALFGVDDSLRAYFPSENELVAVGGTMAASAVSETVMVSLKSFSGQQVSYVIDGQTYSANLLLNGQHNFQNAAAALTLTKALIPTDNAQLVKQLTAVKPAFGRGEVYSLKNGSTVRLVLVKNPSGFRQALASYLPSSAPIMIAINDNIADGRDVSWLWDVDFEQLHGHKVAFTSGKRAADMALRLQYDDIVVDSVEPDILKALQRYAALPGDKLLFTTYTAMLRLYDTLTREAGKSL